MNIIEALNRLRSDIQTWVANNLKVKVNAELKTDSTEEYKVLSDNNFTDADKDKVSNLAKVATSGSYNDLINKPTIPPAQVNSDWNATSGVSQILNKPTIPDTNTVSNWGFTKTNGTVTKVSTGDGLTGGDITATGTIKCNLVNFTRNTSAALASDSDNDNRLYPVSLDKDGKLSVKVPWVKVSLSGDNEELNEALSNYVTKTDIDDYIPALSGGKAATTGKYVSGVTVSGHTVTVTQADLPGEQYKGTVTSITPGTGLTGGSTDAAITTSGTINLKTAATGEIGGIKAGSVSTTSSGANKTINANKFAVHVDKDGLGFVAIPEYTNVTDATVSGWGYMKKTAADSAYAAKSTVTELGNKTITIADKPISLGGSLSRADLADALLLGGAAYCDAGDGLSINADAYGSHLNVNPGDGIKIDENDNVGLKIASSTELGGIKTGYEQNAKNYPLSVDTDGNAYVNVPWAEVTPETLPELTSYKKVQSAVTAPTSSSGVTTSFVDNITQNAQGVISYTKKTVSVTDVSCTESGHYSPSTEASANKQSAGSGKYISGIKLDSKKHVVGIDTGSLPTFTEQYKGTVTGVKINGTTKNPSSGIVDLGTVITEQDVPTHTGQLVADSLQITETGLTVDYSDSMTIAKFNTDGSTELKNIKTLDNGGNVVFEVNETGVHATNIDLNGEPIEDFVDRKIENLATENYVLTEIAKAQLAGTEIDLSGFATKDDLDSKISTINGVEPTDGNVNITDNMIVRYAVCKSAADSNLKEIEIEDYTYTEGSRLVIRLNNGSTVPPGALQVNNSTTGIQYCGNSLPTGTTFPVAHILELTFGRGVWNITGGYQRNDYINGVRTNVNSASATNYGVCDTAADTADKVVSISGDFSLVTGAQVVVKFNKGNTVTASFTLNVNDTGAKNILWGSYSGARRMPVNAILTFVYDGTYWCCKTSNAALTSGNTDLGYALQVLNTDSCGLAIAKNQSIVNGQGDLHIHHGSNENAIYCSGGNIVTETGAVQGNIVHNTRTITASTTLDAKDNIILCNNSSVIDVKIKTNQVLSGQVFTIIKTTTANVTVRTLSSTDSAVQRLKILDTSITSASAHALSGIGVWNLYCIGDYIYLYKQ